MDTKRFFRAGNSLDRPSPPLGIRSSLLYSTSGMSQCGAPLKGGKVDLYVNSGHYIVA